MPPGMAAKVGKSIQVNETLERMRAVLRGNKKVRALPPLLNLGKCIELLARQGDPPHTYFH